MQAHVDYTEVKPVPHQLTIQFINNFVINTTQFLNKFALTCDDKLRDVHNRIQRLEITMNILDAKLNSIEGLEDVRVESSAASSQSAPATSTSTSSAVASAPVVEAEPEPARGGMKNKEDPRYSKYFKMLLVGVPLAQVQNKMMLEGVPPSVLECVLKPAVLVVAPSKIPTIFARNTDSLVLCVLYFTTITTNWCLLKCKVTLTDSLVEI